MSAVNSHSVKVTMDRKERWELIKRFPGGFKFFKDKANEDRIAIADNSGYYPDQTDDGILYIDMTRGFVHEEPTDDRGSQLGRITLKLRKPDGTPAGTFPSIEEIAWCVQELKMNPPIMPWEIPGYEGRFAKKG